MRQRRYAIAFLIVLLAAFAGAFAGARVLYTRLRADLGIGATWTPPTVIADAPTLEPAAGGEPTSTPPATARPVILTPFVPDPTRPITQTPFVPVPTRAPTTAAHTNPVTTEPDMETPGPETPTPTPSRTPSRTPAGAFAFVLAQSVRNTTGDCPGTYVLGQVIDKAGNPLPGVRLRLVDEYGNTVEATTKAGQGDAGRYDFPVAGPARNFTLTVLDGNGAAASRGVQIAHGSGPQAAATCHWVDWKRP